MTRPIGHPPQAEKIHEIVKDRLEAAHRADGEKLTIEWRDQQIHRHVIQLPIQLVYYNPDTHRIRAQRSVDPSRDAHLKSDPWGDEGQRYLEYLLKNQPATPDTRDPEFDALKDDLDDFGQLQPGLITPDGVLVNGNTRCAALRELGKQYIRVAVLPQDTSQDDVSAVELSLQLRRENKRDYSYINRLIAIEEQLARGRHPDEVARDFHAQLKTLQRDQWIFALIQDAIARSQTNEGTSLRLVDFEDHAEKLRELHRAYLSLASSDPDAAETLKETRLALIMLGFAKTDVRFAKPGFFTDYLEARLPSGTITANEAPVTVSIPGLSVAVDSEARSVKAAREVTAQVLQARAISRPGSKAAVAIIKISRDVISTLKESADSALKVASKDERLRERKLAPAEQLSDASEAIDAAAANVAKAMATGTIDEDSLDEGLLALRRALLSLARQIERAVSEPGEGVAWLTGLTQDSA